MMTSGDRLPPFAQSDVTGSRPAVLAVDDVEANLVAIDAVLSDLSCEVVRARSGDEALRWLLRREFAVLLLDVQMPVMDGYEVATYARAHPATRDVPIIFLTAANHTEAGALRGYDSGAVDYLYKPLNPEILRSKVRIFLELFSGRRELARAKIRLEATNAELVHANGELSAAYRDLQATQSQLIQAAKMASLGELVAGVAHEINNPLAFVLSHLGTVRKGLSEVRAELGSGVSPESEERWSKVETRLGQMGAGLDRIRELVIKLRTFSRLDEGEWKMVSVSECLDSVLTIFSHRLGSRVTVEKQLGGADLVECYPSLLNQALLNLVGNALDAMEDSGTLTLSTASDGETYSIAVTDTGSGIPDGLRERVLEPFFTTKPVGQGTGLGLSITYSIVKKHGGTLELRSNVGRGTTAVIRFPVHAHGGS